MNVIVPEWVTAMLDRGSVILTECLSKGSFHSVLLGNLFDLVLKLHTQIAGILGYKLCVQYPDPPHSLPLIADLSLSFCYERDLMLFLSH